MFAAIYGRCVDLFVAGAAIWTWWCSSVCSDFVAGALKHDPWTCGSFSKNRAKPRAKAAFWNFDIVVNALARLRYVSIDAQISWQAQRFVNLEVQISWQASRPLDLELLITLGLNTSRPTSASQKPLRISTVLRLHTCRSPGLSV